MPGTGIFIYIYLYLFTYIYHILPLKQPNIGKYTSPMDGMGLMIEEGNPKRKKRVALNFGTCFNWIATTTSYIDRNLDVQIWMFLQLQYEL